MKIAILDTNSFHNKGSVGRLEGMITCLKETIPGCNITVMHRYYDMDKVDLENKLLKLYPDIELKAHPWYNEKGSKAFTAISFMINLFYNAIKNNFNKTELSDYDIIVDLNLIEPDRLADEDNIIDIIGVYFVFFNIFAASLTRSSFVVCSATVGPYKSKLLRKIAKISLNKSDLITFREKYSYNYTTKNLQIDNPKMVLTADLAFLMESPSEDKIEKIVESLNIDNYKSKLLIGIAPTAMMNSSLPKPEYIGLILELSDYVVNELNANIIYIANTYQDIPIVQDIYKLFNQKEFCKIIPFDLSASETKGIISKCDVFICSRFHALVASTSLYVPSLGIVAYSYNKFHGILGEMMDMDDYLLNIDQNFEYDTFFNKLKLKTAELIVNNENISDNLKKQEKIVRDQVLSNGNLIKEL